MKEGTLATAGTGSSHDLLVFGPILLCSTDQGKDMLQNKFDLI
jgi:hypothetical protein